jgi:hypothetical protein
VARAQCSHCGRLSHARSADHEEKCGFQRWKAVPLQRIAPKLRRRQL